MKNTISSIFSGQISENIHNDFVKFGKGKFENKYLLQGKKQKNQWSIKTGPEFANFLVKKGLEKVTGEIEVSGVIVATFDVQGKAQFPISGVKQFMGVKQAIVQTKTSPQKIISLMDEYPKAFFALSFLNSDFQLKIKAKAPKSAKPSTGGEKQPQADFCSLKTSDVELVRDLFFDNPSFNEVSIRHTLEINEIILPEGISDPVQLREKSQRKGKIIRKAVYDGKEKISEANFLV